MKSLIRWLALFSVLLSATASAQTLDPNLKTKWPPTGWGAPGWSSCAPLTSCVRVAYVSVWNDASIGTIAHAFAGVKDDCALDVFHAYAIDSSGNVLSELGLASQAYTDYFGDPWPNGAVKIAQRSIGGQATLYYRVDFAWDAPLSQYDGCEHAIEVRPKSTHVDVWPADNSDTYTPNI